MVCTMGLVWLLTEFQRMCLNYSTGYSAEGGSAAYGGKTPCFGYTICPVDILAYTDGTELVSNESFCDTMDIRCGVHKMTMMLDDRQMA